MARTVTVTGTFLIEVNISDPLSSTVSGGGVNSPALPTGEPSAWSTVLLTEEFAGTTLNAALWEAGEPYQRTAPGFSAGNKPGVGDENWFPYPMDSESYSVANSILTLKARKRSGLTGQPASALFTGCVINTQGHFDIPANSTCFIESRQLVPTGLGIFTAWWMIGSNLGAYPRSGEVDFTEFINNPGSGGQGYNGLLNETMHSFNQADLDSRNPNQGHRQAQQTYRRATGDLRGEWHVYGFYRSPTKMEMWLDGVKILTWLPDVSYNGYPAIPSGDPIFTNNMQLRLDMKVGGDWAGGGIASSAYEPGDYLIDYVKVWQA